ncbi:2-oxoacid:acceptor oxidoreductase family protein [Promethearchaeum syntrophicum]|uniref:2-oxoacid:acceptor oxidoreductase family protein n=1 Tax=Promethearchaeum syntrophicum TaxID=2594042 RepID=A0A5B9DEY4_9ARCH|nr:2-oxoacid:acceptor oxidoreductase family protein [Candidatus Prometheoarchaeum syntrophicum]QEE17605.1 Indolepyruvate oxidoreductase subunit IorB [Candidatus Prometheoarchaeum syntrophicum]
MSDEKLETYSIVFTGIGGQGLISSIRILGDALLAKNFHAISSETHGLGQRGGKVNTYIRFGTKRIAPLPLRGTVDMIFATEKSAILDVLNYAKPDKSTKILISTYEKRIVDKIYPDQEYIEDALKRSSEDKHIHYIEANKIAQDTIHNTRTENTIMIGYMLRFIPLDKEDIEKILRKYFSRKVLDANLKALEIGISLSLEQI